MIRETESGDKQFSLDELITNTTINTLIDNLLDGEYEDIFAEDDPQPFELNRDGEIFYHISTDKMKVSADFYPFSGNGSPLSIDTILKDLTEMGISHQLVDMRAVSSALHRCNNVGVPAEKVTISRGRYPRTRIPSHIKLIINPQEYIQGTKQLALSEEIENINYRKITQFCILEKGTPVAFREDEKEGAAGMDVYGNEMPYQSSPIPQIRMGRNLEVHNGRVVVTSIDGEYIFQDNEISVNEVLVLTEGVNFHTGDINFPGTVIIKGEVEDNFNIRARENIYALNSIAASQITCDGNLSVETGGIIGRRNNKVTVLGSVKTRHTESVLIEAEQDIFIEKGSLNCQLFTNRELSFGPQGTLIGGETYSKDGIKVHTIGNKAMTHTVLSCGLDYRNVKSLLSLKEYREKLLDAKEHCLCTTQEPSMSRLNHQILKCDLCMERLIREMEYNERAKVVASGTVYPGTVIEICFNKFIVDKKMSNITFFLDKKQGEVSFVANSH